jgi:Signal transduction histidine kinase
MTTSTASLISPVLRVGHDPEFAAVAAQAAQLAFPGVAVQAVASLDDAPAAGDRGEELLLLCNPDAETLERAQKTVDAGGLPRWAIVIFGAPPAIAGAEAAEVIAREDWRADLVERVLRCVLAQHRLRRENARLRGDMGTFGFRVAHDLRTPLGGIVTTTEMLREVLAEDAPQDVALTQPILDSTDGLVKLIERMSFVAKSAVSQEPARRFKMSHAFWAAFQRIEHALMKAGATLEQPKDWPEVVGHQAWMEVVWTNLLRNALQHGGAGVKIEAGWAASDGGWRFWLKDNGKVAPEKRGMLFHPFHRLHEMGAPRGLGLPIVRRLVELDGGRCGYADVPGGGSEFYFVLPSGAEAPKAV